MKSRSRLSRRLEKQSRNNFILTLLGISFLLFVLVKFGVPSLINLSLFLSGSKTSTDSSTKKSESFVPSPILNPLFDATNSAKITISGTASSNETISLYINDQTVDKTKTKENGSFSFENVLLTKGENIIKAKAVTENNNESDFSRSYTVVFKEEKPSLSIDSPSDGQSFKKDENSITVSGKTDSGNKVTVNDFWAIVDGDGKFSYNLNLQNGENKIKITTTDEAGNKTEKEIKVNYSP